MSIELNFKDIVSEMHKKEVKLVFLKNRQGFFVEDVEKNLYAIESLYANAYLDRLIKNKKTINFNIVDKSCIQEWEKEVWDFEDVSDFMKRQNLR